MSRLIHDSISDLPLFAARKERDAILTRVAASAGDAFGLRAAEKIVVLLGSNGSMSGEELVTSCRMLGVVPARDDRAFGPVFAALSRAGRIRKAGHCDRAKGHATAGGIVWELAQ